MFFLTLHIKRSRVLMYKVIEIPFSKRLDYYGNRLEDEISITLYIGGVAVNVQGCDNTTPAHQNSSLSWNTQRPDFSFQKYVLHSSILPVASNWYSVLTLLTHLPHFLT